jgi:hypothetical protein
MSSQRQSSRRIAGLSPSVSDLPSAAAAAALAAAAAAAEAQKDKKEAAAAKRALTLATKKALAAAAAPAAVAANPLVATGGPAAAAAAAAAAPAWTGGLAVAPSADAVAARAELAKSQRLVAELTAQLTAATVAGAAAAATAPTARPAAASAPAAAAPSSSGPKLTKPLTDFYKGESGEVLDAWVEAALQLLRFYVNQTPAESVRWLATGLKGPALKWYNQRYPATGAPPASAEELFSELRLRFQPIDAVETARRELRSLRQGKGTVDAYASRFLELHGQLPKNETSDEALTSQFRAGLQPSVEDALLQIEPQPADLQATMRVAARLAVRRAGRQESAANAEIEDRPATIAEINALLEKAVRQGAASASGGRRASSAFETRRDRGANSRSRSTPIWKEVGLTETEGARRHATGACMWCGQAGHMMRECSQKEQGRPARLN